MIKRGDMILSFSVANFRSFGEETSISFVAGSRSNDHVGHLAAIPGSSRKVLRTSVLYGANGAGKSNLYRAMQVLRDLAIGSIGSPTIAVASVQVLGNGSPVFQV